MKYNINSHYIFMDKRVSISNYYFRVTARQAFIERIDCDVRTSAITRRLQLNDSTFTIALVIRTSLFSRVSLYFKPRWRRTVQQRQPQ